MKTRIITIILLASSAMAFSKPVSRDEAKQIAATLINPSAGQPRFISKNASNNTEAFYIFNDKSGNGWVMVAGDDIAQPVLAYSPTGSFRTTQMPENLHYWLEGYATDIHNAQERGDIASDETKQQWI